MECILKTDQFHIALWGLRRWLGSEDRQLFLQRTLTQAQTPAWQLAAACNSSSTGSNIGLWEPGTHMVHGHTHRQSTHVHMKIHL